MNKLLYYWHWLFGWRKACKITELRAAMITPLAVLQDGGAVKRIAKQIAKSANFNTVSVLVDLQSGRDYIFPGRTATKLDKRSVANLKRIFAQGLTVNLIIRNDWAARTGQGSIPSVNGQVGNDGFYSAGILDLEFRFLESIKWLFPYCHIQLNIEPSSYASGNFARCLAARLRAAGFKGGMLVTPYAAAVASHANLAPTLASLGVRFARSQNWGTTSPDPVFSSDGNTAISSANAGAFIAQVQAAGKPYIIWSSELADCRSSVPDGYL